MKFGFGGLILAFCLSLAVSANVFAARLHHMPTARHGNDNAAAQSAPATSATREISNAFFSMVLPDGWAVRNQKGTTPDQVSVVFNKGRHTMVSLNMMKTPGGAREIAGQTAENMRKSGMKVSEPVEKDGLYVIDIEQNGIKGHGYFGGNGSIAAVTMVFASSPAEVNELLQALKPVDSGLVPSGVE